MNNWHPGQKQTVLVVDDMPDDLTLISGLLKDSYKVKIAHDGKRALTVAMSGTPPDLILMDIMMSVMDGYEACRYLKENAETKDIPVIFLTAKAEEEDEMKGFDLGAVDYITKPISPPIVLARVQTHLRLRRQQIELKALNDLKNHFMGMAAHDLRNPINAIKGFSEFLVEELSPSLTPSQIRCFDIIHNSSEFMLGLINNLLDISVIESGHLTIEKQLVDLSVPITRIIETNRLFASKKDMKIALFHPEGLPQVFVDINRIEQVLNNLLSNAMKYSQPGTDIIVRLRYESSEIVISVADQGPGIPEREQHKLFRAFGKTSVEPTSGERSTGLGLLIAKKIVEANEGRIWFISEMGKGSEFFFSLPVMTVQ